MYLKRVELTGFKSFTEKTKLHFEQGITAVVGPNGCGKSNVVDAVKWCLGEQSTRSLRCQHMMDIVFNGSQKRSPMGMAEVSLVFDNTLNKIPLDFSEITINRKLFRSGESEYYLNKVQCRLKDIRDLFLDTGIGYEGYSIMEQGKVEFILSAKPEERRELFEEAAGVSKYKARRDEALRKMERVQIDLNRIQDTIGMVKDQIRQLDLAVRKAKQYRSGLEELKTIEISDFLFHKDESDASIAAIHKTLQKAQDESTALNASVNREEAHLESLRLSLTGKEKIFSELQGAAYKIDSEITLSETRAETARKKGEELTTQKEQLTQEINAESGKLTETIEEYKKLLEELKEISSGTAVLSAELNEREKNIENEMRLKAEKEEQCQSIKTSLIETEKTRMNIHNDLFQVSSRISRITGEQFSREKEYAKSSEREIQLTAELDQYRAECKAKSAILDASKITRDEAAEKLNNSNEHITRLLQNDDEINQQQLKICARLSALSELLDADPYHKGALSLLSREWKGIFGPLHRLITYSEEYRYLVHDGMGDTLSYFVSETITEAEEALKYLRDNNLGRARFFVLETLPHDISVPFKFITSERPLLSVMTYDSRIENLMRYILQTTYFKGATIYCDHTIEGGADYAPDTYTVGSGTLQEKDLLESKLDELQKARSDNRELLTTIEGESEQLKSIISMLDKKIRDAEISTSLAETELGKRQDEMNMLAAEIHVVNDDLHAFFVQKQDLKSQQQRDHDAGALLEKEITHMRSSLNTVENELAGLNTAMAEKIRETNEIKVRHSQFAERIQHKQQEKERIKVYHCETAQSHILHESTCRTIEQIIKKQRELAKSEQKHIDGLFQQKETQDALVREASDEKNKLQEEIHRIIESVHKQRQEAANLSAEVQRIEIEHQKLLFTEKNMRQNLIEKYKMDFDEARTQFKPESIVSEKLTKLRNRLDTMGSVNLAAPEEYAQLEGRYTFLQQQYQDIITAREDLQRVIRKINATTKENFEKTFHQVQENFGKVYQILFQGGEAKLTLTNEDNLLETGVDIFAQPPGKKLQNISLLSGGEKALTAAALLFAFFMVRPSPICILDEVDAPMDEANVGRFIRLIRDFSKDTQFLIITHNKRTMEIADTLYGVTMEEYGISKVISIRFGSENTIDHTSPRSVKTPAEPAVVS